MTTDLHTRYLQAHKLYEEFWMVDGKKHRDMMKLYESTKKEMNNVCQQIIDILYPNKFDVAFTFFQNRKYCINVFFRGENWDGTQVSIPVFLVNSEREDWFAFKRLLDYAGHKLKM